MKNNTIAIIAIVGVIAGSISGLAYGAISLDNSNRREYVYCPIDPSTLSAKTTYEINGCPTVRVYVDNWNSISELDKSSIDSRLRTSGFKDVDEADARIK